LRRGWSAASSGTENFEACTSQHGSGQRGRRTRALSRLHEAGSSCGRSHVLARDRREKRLAGRAPNIIEDDVKSGVAGFPRKCSDKVGMSLIKSDRGISTQDMKG